MTINFKKSVYSIFKLLGSGLFTTIGFVILASGRIYTIEDDISLFVLIFIQFQMIGLTISKFGIDNLIYANYISDNNYKIDPVVYIKKFGIYLILLFCIISYFTFNLQSAIFLFFLLIFDTFSVLSLIQISARGNYNATLFSNFLSYPLFFLLFFGINFYYSLTKTQILFLLVLCSILRATSSSYNFKFINQPNSLLIFNYKIGLQQILNYVIFKTDQIIFSLGVISASVFNYNDLDLKKFIFLSKFPEIVSGVMVSLAVLYTPYFYINSKEKYLYLISKYKNFIPLAISLAFLGIFFYSFLWKGDDIISVYLLLPYLIHVFLIIIVNMITVGFLKDQKINNLIKNLIISITTGLVTLLIVVLFKLANGLLWAIPIQLLTFSLLPFFKKKRLFK